MKKDRAERDVANAAKAKDLMNDQVLKDAFDRLRADYIRMWEKSPVTDIKLRESMWNAVNIIDGVKSHLRGCIARGTVSDKQLRSIKKEPGKTHSIFGGR